MTVREIVLELASQLFTQRGIKAITMDDIAREAGVSKRTIYENFYDKNDLLRAVLAYMNAQFCHQRDTVTDESENTIEHIFRLMKVGINAMNQINPLFFEDLKKYHLKLWKEVHSVNMETQRNQIFEILRKGINQGLFRKEVNIEIVATILMQQLRLLPDKTIFPQDKFPRQMLLETVLLSFFRGVATTKGIELIDRFLKRDADFFVTA